MFEKIMTLTEKNPFLGGKVQLHVAAFLPSYLVESGFSHFSNLLSKACNQLKML